MIGLKIAFTGLTFFMLSTYIINNLPDRDNCPSWVQACLAATFGGSAAAVICGLLVFVWQL